LRKIIERLVKMPVLLPLFQEELDQWQLQCLWEMFIIFGAREMDFPFI